MKQYSQTGIESLMDQYLPRKGTFLEIGCWDGKLISNSYYLEIDLGWSGVCVDPFPRGFKGRACDVCEMAVSRDGRAREFVKVSKDRRYGGDVSYFSGFADSIAVHLPLIEEFCDYERIMIPTITMDGIYERYNLPDHIDFLSVDTEGSELEIFESIDFSRRSFGMIIFEHNEDVRTRQGIAGILRAHGYTLLDTLRIDDIYLNPHLERIPS